MIRLSKQQFEAIRRDEHVFVGWYIEEIMKNYFPEFFYSLTPESRREMVSNGRRYALEHDLDETEAQGHFVSLMFEIGPNYYMFPGFRDVLRRTDIRNMQKIDLLYQGGVSDAQSRAAIDGADERFWYREDVLVERRG